MLQNVLTVKQSEGCVLGKKGMANLLLSSTLKCETDFVAKNADFVALTQAILDAAVANRCKDFGRSKGFAYG